MGLTALIQECEGGTEGVSYIYVFFVFSLCKLSVAHEKVFYSVSTEFKKKYAMNV